MNATQSTVLLQAQAEPGASDPSFFLMIGAIIMIFYFLTIRPQQRQQKEREASIKALVRGDKILTSGGIHGVVTAVSDDSLTVEIARVKGGARVEVDLARSGVSQVTKAGSDEGGASE